MVCLGVMLDFSKSGNTLTAALKPFHQVIAGMGNHALPKCANIDVLTNYLKSTTSPDSPLCADSVEKLENLQSQNFRLKQFPQSVLVIYDT